MSLFYDYAKFFCRMFCSQVLGLFGELFSGGKFDVKKCVFNDLAGFVRLFCGSAGHTKSFRAVFLIFTTEGNGFRDSRGHDKVHRRSSGVDES